MICRENIQLVSIILGFHITFYQSFGGSFIKRLLQSYSAAIAVWLQLCPVPVFCHPRYLLHLLQGKNIPEVTIFVHQIGASSALGHHLEATDSAISVKISGAAGSATEIVCYSCLVVAVLADSFSIRKKGHSHF